MVKTWTATGLKLGKLTILRDGDSLHVERRYEFLDAGANVLTQIAGGRVVEDISVTDIPPDVLAALQKIDAWTRARALEQEEMDGAT